MPGPPTTALNPVTNMIVSDQCFVHSTYDVIIFAYQGFNSIFTHRTENQIICEDSPAKYI